MSHYTLLETKIVSKSHLVHALKDMGFTDVEVHDSPVPVYNFAGRKTGDMAEVIIRRKHLGKTSNDIGFQRNTENAFDIIVSDADIGNYGGLWLQRLTQRYAYRVALDMLGQKDFDVVEETTDENETIHLTLRRMSA